MDHPKDRRRQLRIAQAIVIKNHRRAAGIEQPQLGRQAAITPRTMSRIEQGEREVTAPELDSIAKVLKTSTVRLIVEAEQLVESGRIPTRAERAIEAWGSALGD